MSNKRSRPCSLLDLSDDEIRRVLSYLWYKDIFRARLISTKVRNIVHRNDGLVYELFANQMTINGARGVNAEVLQRRIKSAHKALLLSARLPVWPTDIDTSDLRYELAEIAVDGQTSKCVAYTGAVLGRNRTFVANHHFPVLRFDSEHCLKTAAELPFTKVIYDKDQQCSVPMSSGIAYFEITIHKTLRRAAEDGGVFTPCVSIGLANHMHRLNRMPGWNEHSYGFHGDDGMFFHSWEYDGVEFADDLESAKFGEGDTVGCGVIYPALTEDRQAHKFLAVNGKFIGACVDHEDRFEYCTWFPCVGTDCHSPIEMNFGNKGVPFVFDIVAFERSVLSDFVNFVPKAWRPVDIQQLSEDGLMEVSTLTATPTITFREPYHEENAFAGGLFRDRDFMFNVRQHLTYHKNVAMEEGDKGSDNSGSSVSAWETEDSGDDDSDGGSDAIEEIIVRPTDYDNIGFEPEEGTPAVEAGGEEDGEGEGSEWETVEGSEGGEGAEVQNAADDSDDDDDDDDLPSGDSSSEDSDDDDEEDMDDDDEDSDSDDEENSIASEERVGPLLGTNLPSDSESSGGDSYD